jgi:hypothetical protein
MKRNILVKQASRYLQKITHGDISNDEKNNKSHEILLGPNPLGLKSFENQVNNQLKNFYRYGESTPETTKSSFLKNISINERIKRIYSKNIKKSKKKQNVIIPKSRYMTNIKTLAPLSRNMNISPYLRVNKKLSGFLETEKNQLTLPLIHSVVGKDISDDKNNQE